MLSIIVSHEYLLQCTRSVGHYMLFSSRFGQPGDRVSLTSRLTKLDKPMLMTFSYYMQGSDGLPSSDLEIIQSSQLLVPGPILFSTSTSTANVWQTYSICLTPGSYHIVFTATQGQPYSSDIAIDNIVLDDTNQKCTPVFDRSGESTCFDINKSIKFKIS